MTITIPRLAYRKTITSGTGPHMTVNYSDATTDDVSIAASSASGYYVQGDSASTCLLKGVQDALNSDPNGYGSTWTVTVSGSGLVTITKTGGAKTADSIDFTTTQIYPFDLGFALTTSTTQIVLATETATSTYRVPSAWYPGVPDYLAKPTRKDGVVLQAGDDGAHVVDVYAGHTRWEHRLFEVYGALVRSEYAGQAAHAGNVSGLATGDTNAPLDEWLQRLHDLMGGTGPTLRWTPDVDTPGTYRNVRILTPEMIASVEGWITETNEAPLWHDLSFMLSEVPS